MRPRLINVTVDTTDPIPLARWWADQLGGRIVQENDGWFVIVNLGGDGPGLAFQKVDDPTPGKNRLHLDLLSDDLDATTAALTAAGAGVVAERAMGDMRWVTFTDPQGNEFCVAQHPDGP